MSDKVPRAVQDFVISATLHQQVPEIRLGLVGEETPGSVVASLTAPSSEDSLHEETGGVPPVTDTETFPALEGRFTPTFEFSGSSEDELDTLEEDPTCGWKQSKAELYPFCVPSSDQEESASNSLPAS